MKPFVFGHRIGEPGWQDKPDQDECPESHVPQRRLILEEPGEDEYQDKENCGKNYLSHHKGKKATTHFP